MKNIVLDLTPPLTPDYAWPRINEAFESLQGNIAGVLSKSIAGGAGTTTLTDEESYNGIIVLSGVITGNRIAEVPAAAMQWKVLNLTTGSFSVTFQAAGGAGVVVPQGFGLDLICDGTDVKDATSAKLDKSGGTLTGPLNGDEEFLADGVTPAYRFLLETRLTSSGTWTRNPKTRYWEAEIVAPGGAGGGAEATTATGESSAGGGGGEGARCVLKSTLTPTSCAFTAGAAGTGVSGNTGNDGGTSTFIGTGVSLSVPGGKGGRTAGKSSAATTTNAICDNTAAPTGGTLNIAGHGGETGRRDSSGASGISYGGSGESSPYGTGGQPVGSNSTNSSLAGNAASGYGSGGGGASTSQSGSAQSAKAGGDGSGAICIIREYA